jgi:hypothetical protein
MKRRKQAVPRRNSTEKLRWRKLAAIESSAPCKNTKKKAASSPLQHKREDRRKGKKGEKRNDQEKEIKESGDKVHG